MMLLPLPPAFETADVFSSPHLCQPAPAPLSPCSYAYLYHQKDMLEDHKRTGAYYNACMQNREQFAGKVVLDVGTGSGILAIFAARAGACVCVRLSWPMQRVLCVRACLHIHSWQPRLFSHACLALCLLVGHTLMPLCCPHLPPPPPPRRPQVRARCML